MSIWISSKEDISFSTDMIVELIYSEKWFTFPDWITVQSFWKDIESLTDKINQDKLYLSTLLKWVNWWIWNSIMELSWKSTEDILHYFNEEYENIIFDVQRLFKNKAAQILQLDNQIDISDDNIPKKISQFRRSIELVLNNPVCLKVNAIDNIDVRHSWTVYNRTIHMPVNLEINKDKSLVELINELKEIIWCTWIFIVDPDWDMYWNMWDISNSSLKIWLARQKSQRNNQKLSKISRTSLPYYSEWPDTLVLSPWHNKWMVASLIRIPIDIDWIRYDLKIFYKKPVYLNNWEVSISIEYAKVFEQKIKEWLVNINCLEL